jgi:hypothetical protein
MLLQQLLEALTCSDKGEVCMQSLTAEPNGYKKATAEDIQWLIKSITKGALNRRNGKGRLILLESSKPSRRIVKALLMRPLPMLQQISRRCRRAILAKRGIHSSLRNIGSDGPFCNTLENKRRNIVREVEDDNAKCARPQSLA